MEPITVFDYETLAKERVQQVLEILHTELERAMKLTGRPTLASIDRSLVKWK